MKRFYLLLIALFAGIAVNAAEVTEAEALQKAQKFMQGKQFKQRSLRRAPQKGVQSNAYYVFNAEGNDGFVVVSGDDRMPEILGYSKKGRLNPEAAPCNVKWLLSYYSEIASVLFSNPQATFAPRRAAKAPIRPLITTTWGQSSPYNDFCPQYNGQKSVTGCVATAMAQVINYNRWPVSQTSGIDAYTTSSVSIDVPALEPTTFNWDNMSNDDVARLMRYCGQSVKMDYGVNESGAFPQDEAPALINIFGYSQTAHYVMDSNYDSYEWEDLLYNELAEQRPIVYNGWGSGGGHTFVVHGYEDGRFYINWGWDGYEDGYFALTGLNTGIGDFNSSQSATIGIQSPEGNSGNRPSIVAKGMTYEGDKFTFRSASEDFLSITLGGTVVSDLSQPAVQTIGLGLYDSNGLINVLWEEQHDFTANNDYQYSATITIGSNIKDGNYRIVPICRNGELNDWQSAANSSDYYVKATIFDDYLKLLACPISEEERQTVDVAIRVKDGITYYLYTYNGKNRAEILPAQKGKYKGDIYIPDAVTHNGTEFHVYKADNRAFQLCEELISLSVATTIAPHVGSCENIEKIDFREGVSSIENPIENCHKLKSVVFPKSLTRFHYGITFCDKVKEIRFNNEELITFSYYPQWHAGSMPALTDVYFQTEEPPLFSWEQSEFVANPSVTIHVPIGAKALYLASAWKNWTIIDDQPLPSSLGVLWGYCDGNTVTQQTIYDTVGDNDAEYAIHVPSEMLEPYKGKKISQIQYYQANSELEYVFITKPGTNYLLKQTTDTDRPTSWVTINLPEPYIITGDELYVGVGSHKKVEMPFADLESVAPESFYFRFMGSDGIFNNLEPGEWARVSDQNEDFNHPIPLRFVITGDDLPYDIQLKDIVLEPNGNNQYSFKAKVKNCSKEKITRYALNWNFDGTNGESKVFDTSLSPSHVEHISIDIPTAFTERNHDFNYTITNVNGETDGVVANSTGTINFNAPANISFPRRVVMEEGTGTWCGFCVRGIETIKKITEEYPDNFIAISLHDSDVMDNVENYNAVRSKFTGFPICYINRSALMNPSYPVIRPVVEQMKEKGEAKVSASATYSKPDSSSVIVRTESIFGFNDTKTANYRLAYVVVEDEVGPYEQNNSYAGATFDEDSKYLEPWGLQPTKVTIKHNNVARGIYGGINGIEGCMPSKISKGIAYTYEYSFVLPDNIQDKKNSRIIVLLIDNNTGEILNACQTEIDYNLSVNDLIFDIRSGDKGLLDGDYVNCYNTLYSDNGTSCSTNRCENSDPLIVQTFKGQQVEGVAKLEILSCTFTCDELIWRMGGTEEKLTGKSSFEKKFQTDNNGKVLVDFSAIGLKEYGVLEAKLTATIQGQSQTIFIRLHNKKIVVNNVTPLSNEIWWKNYDEITDDNFSTVGNYGIERNHAAIHITKEMTEGQYVNGLEFTLSPMWAENVVVWLSTKLPSTDEEADIEKMAIPNEQLDMVGSVYQIAFENSHDIPDEGLYIGYSFDKKYASYYPFPCVNDVIKGSCWLKTDINQPSWKELGKTYGNLKCSVLIGTEKAADPVTVTAKSYTIKYGDALPAFEYTTEGATLNGTPAISCEATSASPVGTYPIVITKGSVTNYNDSYVNGTLTITKAPLKVTAKSYTIKQGDALPTFEVEYSGWKNGETEAVLTTRPTATTTATNDSEPGEYEITVSGGEAQNYELSYVNGMLTITAGTDIMTISAEHPVDVYDLRGNKIRTQATSLSGLPKGVYVVNGRKLVVK